MGSNIETLAVGAVLVAGSVLIMRHKKGVPEQKNYNSRDAVKTVLLNETEAGYYITDMPPISTLTWFKGDYNFAKLVLERRMRLMIKKNPWVLGRISITSFLRGTCQLFYTPIEDQFINLEKYLETISPADSPIVRDMPLGMLGSVIQKAGLMMKNGRHEPILQVKILPCSANPSENFALVVQMSHAVGDGATYYKLLNMICSTEESSITSLIPERIVNSKEMQIKTMGKNEQGYLTSLGFTLKFLRGTVISRFLGPKTTFQFACVDPNQIKEIKKEVMAQAMSDEVEPKAMVPFISTNDIITSWFMNQFSSCGIMAINWRDRLEGHTFSHAGNYETPIFYNAPDYASPILIRKSLDKYKRAITHQDPMPSSWKDAWENLSMVTNWSTFAEPNEIAGCVEDIHVPVATIDKWPSALPVLLIFRAGPGKDGVDVVGSSEKLVKRLGACYFQSGGVNHLDFAPFLVPLKG